MSQDLYPNISYYQSSAPQDEDFQSQPAVNPDFKSEYGSICGSHANAEDVDDHDASHLKGFLHPKHRKHNIVIVLLLLALSFTSIAWITYHFVSVNSGTPQYVSSPPNITYCPDNLTRSSPVEGPASVPVWWVEPLVAQPSGENIAYHASHQPGDLFEIGYTTVTYNFTGNGGLQSVCDFVVSVIVVDGTPPVVTNCPDNISRRTPADDNKVMVDWTEPTAESSRSVSTIKPDPTQSPGSNFSIGTTAINYVFIDSIGLQSTCSFFIAVVDVIPPDVYQCPNDTTFYVASDNNVQKSVTWIEPKATDNSDQASLVSQTHRPGDYFPVGSTAVQYVFKDPSGNINLCSFFIKGKISTTPSASSRTQTSSYGVIVPSLLFTIFTTMNKFK